MLAIDWTPSPSARWTLTQCRLACLRARLAADIRRWRRA